MKKAVRLVAFLLLLSLALMGVSQMLSVKSLDGTYLMSAFYTLPKNTVDVLALGSSMCYENINPVVFWREKGLAVYDLAASRQPAWNSYHYLVEALKTQSPSLILLEATMAARLGDYNQESDVVQNLYGMAWSANKAEALKVSVPEKEWLDYGAEFLRYHSRYQELSREDMLPWLGNENRYSDYMGFMNNYRSVPIDRPDVAEMTGISPLPSKHEDYLRKTLELAQNKNIPVVILVSPAQVTEDQMAVFRALETLAAEYGVPYVNGNLLYDELGLDFQVDFADPTHLNYLGNVKWSRYLCDFVSQRFDLPDNRGDARRATWDRAAAFYDQSMAEHALTECGDLAAYVDALTGLDDCSIYVTLTGDYLSGGAEAESCLAALSELTNVTYTAKFDAKSFGRAELVYDDRVRQMVEHGVNILVYGEYTQAVADVVGFDAEGAYRARR